MTMTSAQFSNLVLPGISKTVEYGMNLRQSMIPRIFNIQPSTQAQEQTLGIGGISVDAWGNYKNSGKPGAVDFNEGHLKTYVNEEFVVEMIIKRTLLEDDKYGIIKGYATRLGVSAFQKREIDGASVFNTAFTGTSGPDSLSLCHATHTGTPDGGVTGDNTGTSALSAAQLSTDRTNMMKFTDDKGNKLGITPDEILVPVDLEDAALTAISPGGLPGTANNDVNPQGRRWTPLVWHQLTDANNWFMMDSVERQMSLIWWDRVPLHLMLVRETTTEFVVEARMRYTYGWADWRFVYGNNVT